MLTWLRNPPVKKRLCSYCLYVYYTVLLLVIALPIYLVSR